MMPTECIPCAAAGRDGSQWTVTDLFIGGRRPRAFLQCRICKTKFSTPAPDAIAAAHAAGFDGITKPAAAVEAPAVDVPAPTLFGATPKVDQGFVKVGSNARRSVEQVLAGAQRQLLNPKRRAR